jgi:hypothetical protein
MWSYEYENLRTKELEPDKTKLGDDEFMSAWVKGPEYFRCMLILCNELHSTDPDIKRLLQLFRQTDKYMTMVVTNTDSSGGRSREMRSVLPFLPSKFPPGLQRSSEAEGIGLERAHLIPAYALEESVVDRYILKFKDEEQNPLAKTLVFKEPQRMWQLCTCRYKVARLTNLEILKFQQAITGYKVVYDVFVLQIRGR